MHSWFWLRKLHPKTWMWKRVLSQRYSKRRIEGTGGFTQVSTYLQNSGYESISLQYCTKEITQQLSPKHQRNNMLYQRARIWCLVRNWSHTALGPNISITLIKATILKKICHAPPRASDRSTVAGVRSSHTVLKSFSGTLILIAYI